MNKIDMREKMLKELSLLDNDIYIKYSNAIHYKIFALPAWEDAKTIGVTISKGREVDTKKLIERAWMENKRVVVPKCEPSSKQMHFREIHSYDDLETVYLNLQEPKLLVTNKADKREIDLMIVPGVVFDRHGYRVGYGGGFYDRYLEEYTGTILALAFSLQVYEEVPFEQHDIPVEMIITEKEVIHCRV
ncbi:5-formyltetrahydrofolate cyclo-ligase [Metabacillus fastidiosus]|uniref:5-formyltetrahydrofolate cyclo-ligase n=1 Tax=Metabacillus fastidiosus TaxID=1458 RepID=UPI002DBD0D3B|nr:5-formyltetrahydrofolate cyclo-ligase [Metabacillus fastidiosus]MEC2076563.1 5-formyltetrahydrofolate cyclo-ligase [Metabacillus fastidiosus]